jgi:hypothetical protein
VKQRLFATLIRCFEEAIVCREMPLVGLRSLVSGDDSGHPAGVQRIECRDGNFVLRSRMTRLAGKFVAGGPDGRIFSLASIWVALAGFCLIGFVWTIFISAMAGVVNAQTAPSPAIQALSAPGSTSEGAESEARAETAAENSSIEAAAKAPDVALDPASLLPDLPPIPAAKATLVGGTIDKLDRVEDRLTIRVFGGGKTSALFDGRTQVYLNGQPASLGQLRAGDRVYVDTILYDGQVFARSIRLRTAAAQGESQGIILSYRPDKNELIVRDATAPEPLQLQLTPATRIVNGGRPASTSDLAEGTLVSIRFGAAGEKHDSAEQISILAMPGATFTFAGKVTFLDLHNNLLVLTSDTNHKTYEIHLGPAVQIEANLREGAEVTAETRFEQDQYVAQRLTVQSSSEK